MLFNKKAGFVGAIIVLLLILVIIVVLFNGLAG